MRHLSNVGSEYVYSTSLTSAAVDIFSYRAEDGTLQSARARSRFTSVLLNPVWKPRIRS